MRKYYFRIISKFRGQKHRKQIRNKSCLLPPLWGRPISLALNPRWISLLGSLLVTPIDFNKFAGKPPVYCCMYTLAPSSDGEDKDTRHINSRKQYYFKVWDQERIQISRWFQRGSKARLIGRAHKGVNRQDVFVCFGNFVWVKVDKLFQITLCSFWKFVGLLQTKPCTSII